MKVFIYVQHLVGIGHLRRALLLAGAMHEVGLDVAVASGGRPVPLFDGPRLHQLEPAWCRPGDFSTVLDRDGRPVTGDWKARRRAELLRRFDEEEPDVLVVETFPFGRRQFRFELLPLLEHARGRPRPPRVVCSIRDILQERSPRREEETVEAVNRLFDAVWVHGDPEWITLERSFSHAEDIRSRVFYTGYVAEPWPKDTGGQDGEVLVSAGGGAAGSALMHCAARARRFSKAAACHWRFLTGDRLDAGEAEQLSGEAGPGVSIGPTRTDFRTLLAGCSVSVSQLGYNTALDLIQARARAVAVPFEGRGETEQTVRARVLESRGLVETVREAALTPPRLAAAIDRALERPRPEPPAIDLAGAGRAARWLVDGAGMVR